MNNTNYIQSFLEYCSGWNKNPNVMELIDVFMKIGTPYQRCITEHTIDAAINALKDFKHSEISESDDYANEFQREVDKNFITAMAEMFKNWAKDFLRARGLLLYSG